MAYNTKEKRAAYDKKRRVEKKELIKETNRLYYLKHKEKIRQKEKEKYHKNKEPSRTVHLKSKYGLTPEKWQEMFDAQQGCCAICQKHQSEFRRKLDTDHCHETGKIRGLLCENCNKAIGLFSNNPSLCNKAMEYLT